MKRSEKDSMIERSGEKVYDVKKWERVGDGKECDGVPGMEFRMEEVGKIL